MDERVVRETTVMPPIAVHSQGSIMLLKSEISPIGGSNLQCTHSSRMSIMPSQNCGIAENMSTMTRITLSKKEFCLRAMAMPRMTPSMVMSRQAPAQRMSVFQMRMPIMSETSCIVLYEVPISP